MQPVKQYLMDWTLTFIKNKDLAFRRIVSIEQNLPDADFIVNYKDGRKQYFFVMEKLEELEQLLSKYNYDFYLGIAAINSKNNIEITIEKWNKFAQYGNLSIYFINPFSNLDKKWILQPFTHNKITEPLSLKLGLKTLFESVEPITLKEFSQKITAQT